MRSALAVFCFLALVAPSSYADTPLTGSFVQAYVPMGFDSNDRTQITLEGTFNDSCYRVDEPLVQVDEASKTIRVEARGRKINGFCFVRPGLFVQTATLGTLSAGRYTITNLDGTKSYDSLTVKPSKVQTQDDYVYASVTQAYVNGPDKNKTLALQISLNPTCQEVKELKVTTQPDVIVVQPILETKDTPCTGSAISTEVTKTLPADLTGHFLLHVRSTAGMALNNMVDL
jgi:hypothetical protein